MLCICNHHILIEKIIESNKSLFQAIAMFEQKLPDLVFKDKLFEYSMFYNLIVFYENIAENDIEFSKARVGIDKGISRGNDGIGIDMIIKPCTK